MGSYNYSDFLFFYINIYNKFNICHNNATYDVIKLVI